MTTKKKDDFIFWARESQKQALIAISKGIAPNEYAPYIAAQKKCHKLFNSNK